MTRVIVKSGICIATLALLLAVLFLAPVSVAAAEDANSPASGFYAVEKGHPLTLYNKDLTVAFQVPATYYVQYINSSADSNGYYTVTYTGAEYLVKQADFVSSCKLHDTQRYGDIPNEKLYYSLTPAYLFGSDHGQSKLKTYTLNASGNMENILDISIDSIQNIYGIYTDAQNNTWYFAAADTITKPFYISANDVTQPQYAAMTVSTVPENPYVQYKAQKDAEIAEQEKNNGNSADPEGGNGVTNNLERIILSIVIAVLCVIVVLLIFRPFHKRKSA